MTRKGIDRKLATILAADVVSYSKMMAQDEEATLTALRELRDIFGSLVERHHGRIFNTAGDAILAEYPSAVEAVRCAVAIQEELALRNSTHPEDKQMWLRIGVNVGDVIIENDDLFGEGVNVASRLEGLAEKGGICISGSTFEQVKNKISIAFADVGPQKLKNIPEMVSAYRLVPGDVSVKTHDTRGKPISGIKLSKGLSHRRLVIGGLVAVFALGLIGWLNLGPSLFANHPYDGKWEVTVEEREGCRNNKGFKYFFDVKESLIEGQGPKFNMKGEITEEGNFKISMISSFGDEVGLHEGVIRRGVGKGRMIGKRAECAGDMKVKRIGG